MYVSFLFSSISLQFMLTLFQVRFALSSDERYTFENFNYNVFYDNVLDHLYTQKLEASTDAILKWWNEYEQFHDRRFLANTQLGNSSLITPHVKRKARASRRRPLEPCHQAPSSRRWLATRRKIRRPHRSRRWPRWPRPVMLRLWTHLGKLFFLLFIYSANSLRSASA
jgi:hypothetical protein